MSNKLQVRLNPVKFRNYLKRLDKEAQVGAKEAMYEALEILTQRIMAEVPRETNTLADSYSFRIIDRGNTITGHFGFGWENNPVNPKTGQKATEYMVQVHEDLEAYHSTGKAKFLEDPVTRFNRDFNRIATMTIMKRLKGAKV